MASSSSGVYRFSGRWVLTSGRRRRAAGAAGRRAWGGGAIGAATGGSGRRGPLGGSRRGRRRLAGPAGRLVAADAEAAGRGAAAAHRLADSRRRTCSRSASAAAACSGWAGSRARGRGEPPARAAAAGAAAVGRVARERAAAASRAATSARRRAAPSGGRDGRTRPSRPARAAGGRRGRGRAPAGAGAAAWPAAAGRSIGAAGAAGLRGRRGDGGRRAGAPRRPARRVAERAGAGPGGRARLSALIGGRLRGARARRRRWRARRGGRRRLRPEALFINCLIRSTIAGSRLARALTLTSSPHFWIRSSSSWLFRPSSFANSWTRVDNGNSSWIGLRPDSADRPARWSSGDSDRSDRSQAECRSHPGVSRPGVARDGVDSGRRVGVVDAVGPRWQAHARASWLIHFRIASLDLVGREGFRGGQRGDIPPAAGFVRPRSPAGEAPGLDRLGHDPDRLVLIGVARRRGHLVAVRRPTRRLGRQGQVVDLVGSSDAVVRSSESVAVSELGLGVDRVRRPVGTAEPSSSVGGVASSADAVSSTSSSPVVPSRSSPVGGRLGRRVRRRLASPALGSATGDRRVLPCGGAAPRSAPRPGSRPGRRSRLPVLRSNPQLCSPDRRFP